MRLFRRPLDEIVDVASVVIISCATVFSAWCGFEAAKWSGVQTERYQAANSTRIAASETLDRANAEQVVNVQLFLQYMVSDLQGRTDIATYIERRFRPEVKVAMKAWLATKPLTNPHAPPTPFTMRQYHLAARNQASKLNARAEEIVEMALKARNRSDRYVLLTVLFASVSFLGGVSTKLRAPLHVILVSFGTIVLTGSVIALFFIP